MHQICIKYEGGWGRGIGIWCRWKNNADSSLIFCCFLSLARVPSVLPVKHKCCEPALLITCPRATAVNNWLYRLIPVCSLFVLMHRNDWNLLSTATPAINAWMNPCHRAVQASDILYGQLSKRVCTVMACIMTEALDYERLHMPYKVSYSCYYWWHMAYLECSALPINKPWTVKLPAAM